MKTALILILVNPIFAYGLSLTDLQGKHQASFPTPTGKSEICVTPKHWINGGYYRSKDSEDETELCNFNFYSNIGICPKYNSTNPGVLLLKPTDKYSKEAIDSSNCNVDAMKLKTTAKFKQSISCSNTSSILAYYQLSRILGDIGRVPVSVIRTMDIQTHFALTQKANNHLRGSKETIAKTWSNFAQVHRRPSSYPLIVDSSLTQIYGALSVNPKNEEKYSEINGSGSYETRYERFLQQKPFLRVASSKSVEQMLGTTDFTKVAQTVTQMKDISDMVLLDTLLNQQDRIGNIHYKFYWYALSTENPEQIVRIKSGAESKNGQISIPKEEKAEMSSRTAVLLKEMILKDNDCGVEKENMMRKYSVLEKIRHMSHLTYSLFLAFERDLAMPEAQNYFMTELLFSKKEFEALVANAAKAKSILTGRCRSGQLRFDIDIADYVTGRPVPQRSCDM